MFLCYSNFVFDNDITKVSNLADWKLVEYKN